MKRFHELLVLSIVTIILQSSGNKSSDLPRITEMSIGRDTTGLMRLVELDSFRLNILPPSSGVQFYKDGIIFLSMSKYENSMSPNQISFGTTEAYYASLSDSALGKHIIFSPFFSFSFPCEGTTFSHNGDTVYFTKYSKNDRKEKIFMAKFSLNGKNQVYLDPEATPLDFCSDNYNYSHPALSSDDKLMVFASDRVGSLGGMDLFVSRLYNGKWSVPENLGKSINTTGNEFFPFLDSENNLYFSSDGLPGFGGYDIFTCKFNGANWDKPVNLTGRINSGSDDIAFTINKTDGKTGFFARRQKDGKGDIQLFRITVKKQLQNSEKSTLNYVFNGNRVPKNNFAAVSSITDNKSTEPKLPDTKKVSELVKTDNPNVPGTGSKVKLEARKDSVSNHTKNIRKSSDVKLTESKKVGQVVKTENSKTAVTEEKSKMAYRSDSVSKQTKNIGLAENKSSASKPALPAAVEKNDMVIYRVQLLPGPSQIASKMMVINGENYKIFEYQFRGALRFTIGEFNTLTPATTLQNICRKSGFPQSFVVAFKNNIRSLDESLFKK
jgi:WD40-like Beta Propeller Repeat